jgi:hypothetical protein
MARFPAALLAGALALAAPPVSAQLIPIRVVPMAEADQFGFFPSANFGMANVSIALADSLLDPVRNPALGSRVGRGRYFGGPTFFAVTNDAGSGQTLPLGALARVGRVFLGGAVAVQEIAPARPRQTFGFPIELLLQSSVAPGPFQQAEPNQPRSNRYGHATAGYAFPGGWSVGASGLWSSLGAMEGSELLFTGSHNVRQRGERSDVRIGAARQWGARSLEAVVLRTSYAMHYDVGYAQVFWDPATRSQQVATWVVASDADAATNGVHLQFSTPLRDSSWRFGAIATANVMRESASPYYEFMGIPRDPSNTRAFNLGAGVSRRRGPVTVALDAVIEPAWRRATGRADTSIAPTVDGNREESYFRFRNAVVRAGVAREIGLLDRSSHLRLQAGTELRSVNYDVEQHDRLRSTFRERSNSWREWTHGAGATFVFSRFEFGYQLRVLSGMGRLGVPPETDFGPVVFDSFRGGPVSAGITLYPVRVTSHQMFFTVPVR